jgi:hypothetical protein
MTVEAGIIRSKPPPGPVTVPETSTLVVGVLLLLPFGLSALRLRSRQTADGVVGG